MIVFSRRSLWESALRVIPSVRKRQDAAVREAIRKLVVDPSLPCVIDGKLVPDGRGPSAGATSDWQAQLHRAD